MFTSKPVFFSKCHLLASFDYFKSDKCSFCFHFDLGMFNVIRYPIKRLAEVVWSSFILRHGTSHQPSYLLSNIPAHRNPIVTNTTTEKKKISSYRKLLKILYISSNSNTALLHKMELYAITDAYLENNTFFFFYIWTNILTSIVF